MANEITNTQEDKDMAWYQIDRINPNTGITDMEYKMVQAASAKQALANYLTSKGYDLDDEDAPVTIGWEKINGAMTMTARCPADTSDYWTATKQPGGGKDIMLPARIYKAREVAGLTQAELAQAVNTTQAMISRYEIGEQEPTVSRLIDIAKALKIKPSQLID